MPRKIEISHKTIVFTVVFLILLWFLVYIKDILLQLFVSLIIMATLNPYVTKLNKYKIPRAASVILVYISALIIFSLVFLAIIPALVEQTTSFVNNLPKLLMRLGIPTFITQQFFSQSISQLGSIPGQIVKTISSVFSNVFALLGVLIFSFYLLIYRDRLDTQLGYFFGGEKKVKFGKMVDTWELKMGGWARGQATLMFVVGVMTYVGLKLLGIPFAIPLAILAGLFEIIPYLGPMLSAIPAVIIGFGISAITGFAVSALYFLVQQLENYALVPSVMKKTVGVNPIITLIALAVGFRLAGILGVFLSVPLVVTLQVFVQEYWSKEKI